MSQEKSPDCFAFLTVRFSEAVGYFGGLLSINRLGRPVEFHCSLPIKPSRAQSILYGDTLNDFLVGEQISYAIVSKIRNVPKLILTDLVAALPLRRIHPIPVACIEDRKESDTNALGFPMQIPKSQLHKQMHSFHICGTTLSVLQDFSEDEKKIQEIWQSSAPQFGFREPFDRIVEALREANPSAKAA